MRLKYTHFIIFQIPRRERSNDLISILKSYGFDVMKARINRRCTSSHSTVLLKFMPKYENKVVPLCCLPFHLASISAKLPY